MKHPIRCTSDTISALLSIPRLEEPKYEDILKACRGGIFIGCSEIFNIPFFIDFDFLINPHVFIVGMSGGGKTYLTRNLMLKLHVCLNATVIVIDFTGEYKAFVEASGDSEVAARDLEKRMQDKKGIIYINLKGYNENNKISMAEYVLERIVYFMRQQSVNGPKRIFVVLDEAWKLLGRNKALEMIVREGRKYNTGLIFASQLVEDTEVPILGNISTLFVFRTQNKKSLDKLSKNYGISSEQLARIQNLDVGSCFLILLYKANVKEAFVIKRITGIDVKSYSRIGLGENMIEVDSRNLEAVIKGLCKDDPSELILEINGNGYIELQELIKHLILLGADRRRILSSVRGMNISDAEIADAFSFAIEKLGESDGQSV